MTRVAPWQVLVTFVAAAPLLGCLALFARVAPWTGLPQIPEVLLPNGKVAAISVDLWSSATFTLVGFALVALLVRGDVWVSARDRWLALAITVCGLMTFYRGPLFNPTHTFFFALGAIALVAARATPVTSWPTVRHVLVGAGVFQACYALHQWAGYDLLWGRLDGDLWGRLRYAKETSIEMYGTLGTVDATSAYIAILTPLMPVAVMPLGIAAVLLSNSAGATLALLLALAVRFRHRLRLIYAAPIAGACFASLWSLSYVATGHFHLDKLAASIAGRAAIADFALRVWWQTASPLTGWGLGGWALVVPQAQQALGFAHTGELWREAHNELLQWVCEAGFIGLALLALWLVEHRAMFTRDPWAPSLAALAVVTLTFFPWHIVPVALLGIFLIGVASSTSQPIEGVAA